MIHDTLVSCRLDYDKDRIRACAVEIIRYIYHHWKDTARIRNDTPLDETREFHTWSLAYVAQMKLVQYDDDPQALPHKLIPCFTNHIPPSGRMTVGVMVQILCAAARVHAWQMSEIKGQDPIDEVGKEIHDDEASGLLGDMAADLVDETDHGMEGLTNFGTTMPHDSGQQVTDDDEDDGDDNGSSTQADCDPNFKQVAPAASDAMPAAASQQSSEGSARPNQTSGNDKAAKQIYVPFFSDEDQFIRNAISENPKRKWEQLADDVTARFKGTYYTDPSGYTHSQMRLGRSVSVLKGRYEKFRASVRSQAKQRALSGKNATGSHASASELTE